MSPEVAVLVISLAVVLAAGLMMLIFTNSGPKREIPPCFSPRSNCWCTTCQKQKAEKQHQATLATLNQKRRSAVLPPMQWNNIYTIPTAELPEVEQQDPLRGYKVGIFDTRNWIIKGPMAANAKYQVGEIEKASCFKREAAYPSHPCPDPSSRCACGFNAYSSATNTNMIRMLLQSFGRESIERLYPVILDVDLYGKIVEYSRGFRAEYQRILSITVPYTDIFDYILDQKLDANPCSDVKFLAYTRRLYGLKKMDKYKAEETVALLQKAMPQIESKSDLLESRLIERSTYYRSRY